MEKYIIKTGYKLEEYMKTEFDHEHLNPIQYPNWKDILALI